MPIAGGFLQCCHLAADTIRLAQNMPALRSKSTAFLEEACLRSGESCGATPSTPAAMTLYHETHLPFSSRAGSH